MKEQNSLLTEIELDDVLDDSGIDENDVRNYDFMLCVHIACSTKGSEERFDFYKRIIGSREFADIVNIVDWTTSFYEYKFFGLLESSNFSSYVNNVIDMLETFHQFEVSGVKIYTNFGDFVRQYVGSHELLAVFGIKREQVSIRSAVSFVWKIFNTFGKNFSFQVNYMTAFSEYDLSRDEFNKMYSNNTLFLIKTEAISENNLRGFYEAVIGRHIEMNEWFHLLTMEMNARLAIQDAKTKNALGFDYIEDNAEKRDVVYFGGYHNYVKDNSVLLPNIWFLKASGFYDGIAVVRRPTDGKYVYIDVDGKPIFKAAFVEATAFTGDYAIIKREKQPSYNIITKSFKLLSNEWYDLISQSDVYNLGFHASYALVLKIINGNKRWNYIGIDGKLVSDEWFDRAEEGVSSTPDGMFMMVEKNRKVRIFNMENGYLSDVWFNSVWFNEDCKRHDRDDFFVVYNDKEEYDVLDRHGNFVYGWCKNNKKIDDLLYYKCIQVY